jgi:hypothetical protein
MDVWRYSDVDGSGAQQFSQPHIWRWRDWIVASLNADKGYDRMVVEMLAADELAPEDPDTLRATGFLVRNFRKFYREPWLHDAVEHTAQAFLGVTLRCARCHDHMYDPITQEEYYRVRAVFEPHDVRIDHLPGQADPLQEGVARVYDARPEEKTFLLLRGDPRTPGKEPLGPGVPQSLGGRLRVEPVRLPPVAYAPEKRAFVAHDAVAASAAAAEKARGPLRAARHRAAAAVALLLNGHPLRAAAGGAALRQPLDALTVVELDAAVAEARHLALEATVRAELLEAAGRKDAAEWKQAAEAAVLAQRGLQLREARKNLHAARAAHQAAAAGARAEAAKKVQAAEKALAKAEADVKLPPGTAYTPRAVKVYPQVSTGRRLALARWIADRANPLTARVAVNHLWAHHFGRALAPRTYDLGRNAPPPSHPALLDWLAAELMDRDWSMKALHRLLVTSSTYRLASTPDPADIARDGDNRYYWRMPSRRLEAEAVRDSVLYVAGRLDGTLGGPDIDHALGLTSPRRSLYFRHAESKQMTFLTVFDGASVVECYQRVESVVPQQALALLNSELTRAQARALARSLAATPGADPRALAAAAFERVLARPPTAEELAACAVFLEDGSRRKVPRAGPTPADPRACENLVHTLMNHHEFVTVR